MSITQVDRYKIRTQSKFKPPNTAFCNSATCCCEVQLRDDGSCPRCFCKPSKRKKHYRYAEKRFLAILEMNREYLSTHVYDVAEQNGLHIPVQIGHYTYAVPLRYFVEFENISNTNKKNYPAFFEHITKVCKQL